MTKHLTAAEANVLDALLPDALTDEMRDVALCLYEALVLQTGRAGQVQPDAGWLVVLQRLAAQAVMQLQHLAREKGGRAIYLAKGVAVFLSARDRELCAAFRGNNYRELADRYGLTEMRVRQIIEAWRREQYARRQGCLPGLDMQD